MAIQNHSRDWALTEAPVYTVEQIIRYWCEIPDDRPMQTDQMGLPVDDAAHPMIKVRREFLMDAIKSRKLRGSDGAPQARGESGRSALQRWLSVRRDELIGWFDDNPDFGRPAFLFWREDQEVKDESLTNTEKSPIGCVSEKEEPSVLEILAKVDPMSRTVFPRI